VSQPRPARASESRGAAETFVPEDQPRHVVVVGASWGGLHALTTIVRALPPAFAAPMLIVQHRSRDAASLLAELLQDVTPLSVCEVEDKEPLRDAHVYVAPPDYHVLFDDGHFALSTEAAVRFSRPSIDVALASAADTYSTRAIGVVLTGANEDGAQGLLRVVERGGWGIVQTPATAEVRTMPEAALNALRASGSRRWIVSALEQIARELVALVDTGLPAEGATA
jgi:two-component system, chemotaxis family, protein-glutamate methylesterase/glutaminase